MSHSTDLKGALNNNSKSKDLGALLFILLILPFVYFAFIVPKVALEQSIDLAIISLFFAIIAGAAWRVSESWEHHKALSISPKALSILSIILTLSAFLRLYNLDYNGPFIDEYMNFEIASIGNSDFIASDSRLYGVLAGQGQAFGGLTFVRAINGMLGTLSIALVFFFSLRLLETNQKLISATTSSLIAALLFSLSAPALFISNLATHDSLALLFFILGLYLLAEGASRNFLHLLVVSAFCFFLSFCSRYFISPLFVTIPLLMHYLDGHHPLRLKDRWLWFWGSFTCFFLIYFLFNGYHIYVTVRLGASISEEISNIGLNGVISALVLFSLPAIATTIVSIPMNSWRSGLANFDSKLLWLLSIGALAIPAIHLLKATDFGMEKNLAYPLLFASILIALSFTQGLNKQLKNGLLGYLAIASATIFIFFFIWLGSVSLMPLATRVDFSSQVARQVEALRRSPLSNTMLGVTRLMQSRWLKPDQILSDLESLGLSKQRIAVLGQHGGGHISWMLSHKLGRIPGKQEYYTDLVSAWSDNTFGHAIENKIPIVLAVIPDTKIALFERHRKAPEYQLLSTSFVPGVEGKYGKVYVFLNPEWLNPQTLHSESAPYLNALYSLHAELKVHMREHNRQGVEQIIETVKKEIERENNTSRKFHLLVELGLSIAQLGDSFQALSYFNRAKDLADASEAAVKTRLSATLEKRVRESSYFRVSEHERLQLDLVEVDILPLGVPGSSTAKANRDTKGKAFWLDFDPAVEIKKNSFLKIRTNISKANAAGFRLVEIDQDFSDLGWMWLMPFSKGETTFYLPINKQLKMKQLNVQVGEKAWDIDLNGSPVAEVEFKAVSIVELPESSIYLSLMNNSLPSEAQSHLKQ